MPDQERIVVNLEDEVPSPAAIEPPVDVQLEGDPVPAETRPPTPEELAQIQPEATPPTAENLIVPSGEVIDTESKDRAPIPPTLSRQSYTPTTHPRSPDPRGNS